MVALVLVSLMALLAWRGIEGMSQAVQQTAAHEQSAQRLSTALAQWMADLDALTETNHIKALDYDGQLVRMTRRSTDPTGVTVVAWVIRSGRLLRYASPAVTDKTALQVAYLAATRWGRTPLPEDAVRTVDLMAADSWQIFYYRGEAWSNPLSSPSTASADVVPDGIRLTLTVPAGVNWAGNITRDWVQPALGATR